MIHLMTLFIMSLNCGHKLRNTCITLLQNKLSQIRNVNCPLSLKRHSEWHCHTWYESGSEENLPQTITDDDFPWLIPIEPLNQHEQRWKWRTLTIHKKTGLILEEKLLQSEKEETYYSGPGTLNPTITLVLSLDFKET